MFRMNALNIDLLTLQEDSFEATYILRDEYFNSLDNAEIKGGDVCSEVTLTRVSPTEFSLSLKIAGAVIVPCDRCLDDMAQPVKGEAEYAVRLGQATDVEIAAKNLLKTKEKLNRILAENCGKDYETLVKDTDRDNWMSANEAMEYGLVDKVIEKR